MRFKEQSCLWAQLFLTRHCEERSRACHEQSVVEAIYEAIYTW